MKYELIAGRLKKDIEARKYASGQRLPSIRYLAEEMGTSKGTVIKALEILEKENLCYAVPKSGFYVIQRDQVVKTDSVVYPFDKVLIHPSMLPYKEFQHCVKKATDHLEAEHYQYGEFEGSRRLRAEITSSLANEGIAVDIDQVLITNGAIQSLNLLIQYISQNKMTLLVENPTYDLVLRMTEHYPIDLVTIDREPDGYDSKLLEERMKEADFFFVMPNHHNPLGVTLSVQWKKSLLKLSEKHDVILVEDDYLADVLPRKKFPSLRYLDLGQRVIYVRSFSKGFLPGVRLGYTVLPDMKTTIKEELLGLKKQTDYCSATFNQQAMTYYIQTGMFDRHRKKMKTLYMRRMNKVKKLLDVFLPGGIHCEADVSGIFIYLHFDRRINENLVDQWSGKHGIQLVWGGRSHLDYRTQGIRLCVSGMTDDEAVKGLRILLSGLGKMINP